MATSGSRQQQLLGEVHERIQRLQLALEQVAVTRKQLQCNTSQVREQIQSGVSRQLEALRTREVWLLQQVEVVQGVKEAVLRQQTETLQQALGGLHAYAQCGEEGDMASMMEHLQSVDGLETQPEENAALSFRADSVGLRTAIQHWGRVDGRYGPLEGAFADAGLGAASLPCVLEDYEDEEHHVLYKTVQALKGSAENVIDVKIPRLSERPQDWLLPPSPPQVANTADEQPPLLFPPFRQRLSEWLNEENMMPNNSLQQWLTELWNEGTPEDEEDFDVLASSCAQSVNGEETELMTGSSVSLPEYFEQVSTAPIISWLLGSTLPSVTYPYQVMQYFREVATSTKQWLLQYHQGHLEEQRQSVVEGRQSPVRDIEDLDREVQMCTAVTSYFNEVPSDTSMWLHVNQKEKLDMDADLEEKSIDKKREDRIHELVQRLCIANEPCQDFSQCLGDKNCGLKCRTSSNVPGGEGMQKWLLGDRPHKTCVCLAEGDVFSHGNLTTSEWLMPGEASNCNANPVQYPPFSRTPLVSSYWLSGKSNEIGRSQSFQFPYFSHIHESHAHQWVHPIQTEDNHTESVFFRQVDFTHSQDDVNVWLHGSRAVSESNQSTATLQICLYTPLDIDVGSLVSHSDNKWLVSNHDCPDDVFQPEKIFSIFKQISSSEGHWLTAINKEVSETMEKSDELPELSQSESSFQMIKDDFDIQEWLLVPPV